MNCSDVNQEQSGGDEGRLRTTARTAGFWYLLMGAGTAFGMGYVNPLLRVSDDGAVVAGAIQSAPALFLGGCASTSLGLITMLFLASSLFELFAHIDRRLGRLLVIFVVVGVAISLLNMANVLAAIRLATCDGPLSGFDQAQRHGLMMTLLHIYEYGGALATFFWGLWLLPFGMLLLRCGVAPRPLGILMFAGCFPYLVHGAAVLFWPAITHTTSLGLMVPTVGEVWAIGWLLLAAFRNQTIVNNQ